jgi:hypothetical protein
MEAIYFSEVSVDVSVHSRGIAFQKRDLFIVTAVIA